MGQTGSPLPPGAESNLGQGLLPEEQHAEGQRHKGLVPFVSAQPGPFCIGGKRGKTLPGLRTQNPVPFLVHHCPPLALAPSTPKSESCSSGGPGALGAHGHTLLCRADEAPPGPEMRRQLRREERTARHAGPAAGRFSGTLGNASLLGASVAFREVSWASSPSHPLVKTSSDFSQPPKHGALEWRGPGSPLLGGTITVSEALPSEVTSRLLQPRPPPAPSSGLACPYPATSQAPGPGPSGAGGSSAPSLAAPAGVFPQVLPCPAQAAPLPVGAC